MPMAAQDLEKNKYQMITTTKGASNDQSSDTDTSGESAMESDMDLSKFYQNRPMSMDGQLWYVVKLTTL